jgi:hypothetical protein
VLWIIGAQSFAGWLRGFSPRARLAAADVCVDEYKRFIDASNGAIIVRVVIPVKRF